MLGKGTFGNVYLTRFPQTKILYALKIIPRYKIQAKDLYENLKAERDVLMMIDHPFLLKLVKTFKDTHCIYFLTEYVDGEDLFDVMRAFGIVGDKDARFYIASLILALEHLAERNIVHRDLKPENMVVDS
jgi:cGMP-dependent protein kinase